MQGRREDTMQGDRTDPEVRLFYDRDEDRRDVLVAAVRAGGELGGE